MAGRIAGEWDGDGKQREEKPKREYLNSLIPYLLVSGIILTSGLYAVYVGYLSKKDKQFREEQEKQQKEREKEGLKDKLMPHILLPGAQ